MPKRRGSHRAEQVAETIRQVVADALVRDVRDPRIGFVTITSVEVTRDLGYAKIQVTVTGDEESREATLVGLRNAAGFLRSRLARALDTRTVPELRFELDRGEEHRARIEEVLARLRQEPDA